MKRSTADNKHDQDDLDFGGGAAFNEGGADGGGEANICPSHGGKRSKKSSEDDGKDSDGKHGERQEGGHEPTYPNAREGLSQLLQTCIAAGPYACAGKLQSEIKPQIIIQASGKKAGLRPRSCRLDLPLTSEQEAAVVDAASRSGK